MQILEPPSSNGHARVTTVVLPPVRAPRRWRALVAVAVTLALILTGALVLRARSTAAPAYVTQPVVRADLVRTVTATGTVNPQNTINVGTQVSGTISAIDADYNAQVHTGQVLARIDPTALQEALASARAGLAQAQAQAAADAAAADGSAVGIGGAQAAADAAAASARAAQATALSNQQAIASADAAVVKAQSALVLAQQTMTRDRELLASGYVAQNQVDADAAALVAAQTTLQSAQAAANQARSVAAASVAQAQASGATTTAQNEAVVAARAAATGSAQTAAAQTAAIGIQEAAVEQAETNLAHAVITSPVDGTVIARDVSVGTTVAASLQTPTLFEIAQNLNKMEVDLAVGEPDIGSVAPGQAVDFTVLAFPSRTFHGVVSQVREAPVITSNVVTYTTVVLVDNADHALLPGMTANATIHVQTASNALVVPIAALEYQPSGGARAVHAASPWGATSGSAASPPASGAQGRIFVERNGRLVRVPVAISLVTSTQAAVVPQTGAALAAGDAVVTGDTSAVAATHPRAASASQNVLTGAPTAMRVPR